MTLELPRDQYIQVGEHRARYWSVGEGEATILLLHGLGMSVENWQGTIQRLAPSARVVAVDHLGFGKSAKPKHERWTPTRLGTFVLDFMDAIELDRVHLVGHSMGGAVAISVAARWPARVESLVIIAAGGLGREVFLPMRLMALPGVGELLTVSKRSSTARSLRASVYDRRAIPEELIDATYEVNARPGSRHAFLGILRTALSIRGVRPERHQQMRGFLRRIHLPTMALWGVQDPVVPVDHLEPVRELVHDVRIERLDHCGHFPMLEHPEKFHSLLVDFFEHGSAQPAAA